MAKGVSGIIILLPILGECWLRTIPKALPWADLFLAFLSPLCFESEQARAQAVFTPTVYTPLPWGGGGGDVKPTPALPKGGGIMSFCPSVRNKGVGVSLPSLGERLRVGELRSGMGPVVGVRFTPRRGIDMPAPGNARGGGGCRRDTPPKGAKE